MKNIFRLRWLIVAILLFSKVNAYGATPLPDKGSLVLGDTTTEIWGSYKVKHMLFPNEEWKFFVLVVPKSVKQGDLIKISKEVFAKYPNTRVRFFSDKKHIKQYVDRDRFINDKTGKVKEVEFPDSKWVQNHLLGNINNRSTLHNRHWMLEDRYGNNISLLP